MNQLNETLHMNVYFPRDATSMSGSNFVMMKIISKKNIIIT